MVEPTALRIGNIILSDGEPCRVKSVSTASIETEPLEHVPGREGVAGTLEYMPLTEDWMKKATGNDTGYLTISGSERSTESSDISIVSTIEAYVHEDGFLRVCAYEYDKLPDDSIEISDDVITLGYQHIRYVHQVQNLYFDLTGKELTM